LENVTNPFSQKPLGNKTTQQMNITLMVLYKVYISFFNLKTKMAATTRVYHTCSFYRKCQTRGSPEPVSLTWLFMQIMAVLSILLRPFGLLVPKDFNYLASQSLDYEHSYGFSSMST